MEDMRSFNKLLETANATFQQAVSGFFTFRLNRQKYWIDPVAVANKKSSRNECALPQRRWELKWCFLPKYMNTKAIWSTMYFHAYWSTSDRHRHKRHSAKGGRAMIMRDIPMPIKCPKCSSENVKSKWTLNTILTWICRLLAVPTVKIYDKKCEACGEEFQIFRKWGGDKMAQCKDLGMRKTIFIARLPK